MDHLPAVLGLILGGVVAAPLAGWIAKHARPRLLTAAVGLWIVGLSAFQAFEIVTAATR